MVLFIGRRLLSLAGPLVIVDRPLLLLAGPPMSLDGPLTIVGHPPHRPYPLSLAGPSWYWSGFLSRLPSDFRPACQEFTHWNYFWTWSHQRPWPWAMASPNCPILFLCFFSALELNKELYRYRVTIHILIFIFCLFLYIIWLWVLFIIWSKSDMIWWTKKKIKICIVTLYIYSSWVNSKA